ncbi:MAG: histidine phosphatase family protein [Woeseiaceae bacterium]|nr:histidine phosphatase family protein [Woeseiaceae bacterium]
MKILTIVRHAKSSWKDASLSDRHRPLNGRGKRDAPVMGRRIHKHGIRPSLIISSPAVRAWTTAKVVAAELNYPQEFLQRESGLYLAALDQLLDIIMSQDDGFNSLMLFGHNPGLTDLVNYVQPGLTQNLPTAGVVSVGLHQDDWNLYEQPETELLVHDWPKKLPR